MALGQEPHPGSPRAEYLVSAALSVADIPEAVILAQVRPPIPEILVPPRFGYPDNALTIEEVLDTRRWNPQARQFTSGLGSISRQPVTDRNNFQEDVWTGTSRNSLGTV